VKLTEADVRHVATLSGLALSEAEVSRMVGEISAILDYVEGLSAVESAHVQEEGAEAPPTPLSADLVVPSLTADRALASAPDRAGNFFRVPRILEEGR
jgi:aspartyl-tRNA(Asn)/glutamyl-tRNA(Gln) amidotransferase subunit C